MLRELWGQLLSKIIELCPLDTTAHPLTAKIVTKGDVRDVIQMQDLVSDLICAFVSMLKRMQSSKEAEQKRTAVLVM